MTEPQLTTQSSLPSSSENEETTLIRPSEVSAGALIQQAVLQGDVSIDVIERLCALQERQDAAKAKAALIQALHAFQTDCPVIGKSRPVYGKDRAKGPQYHFASFADIKKVIQPILERHGLMFSHSVEEKFITCTVSHRDGASVESAFPMAAADAPNMNGAQRMASSSSYAKRYSLMGALGIAVGDDDDAQGVPDLVTKKHLAELFLTWKRKHHPKESASDEQFESFRNWSRTNIFSGEMSDEDLRDPLRWTTDDIRHGTEVLTRVSFDDYTDTKPEPPADGPSRAWSELNEAMSRADAAGLKSLRITLDERRGKMPPAEYDELSRRLETA